MLPAANDERDPPPATTANPEPRGPRRLDRRNGSGRISCSRQWSRELHASGGCKSDLPGKCRPRHRVFASPRLRPPVIITSGVTAPTRSEDFRRCRRPRCHASDHDAVSSRTTSVIHRRRQPQPPSHEARGGWIEAMVRHAMDHALRPPKYHATPAITDPPTHTVIRRHDCSLCER
jgi:hypothetical protein